MPKTGVLSRFCLPVRASSLTCWLRAGLAALIIAMTPAPGAAQDADAQTLADIRQELSVVYVMIQRLKRELSTTQAPTTQTGGDSYLERLDAIEAALRVLTDRTEALENRVNRIVADGTNRIGDLEFRLVELEGGDLSTLGETTTLGGEVPDTGILPPAVAPSDGAPQLAVGERADFDAARAALDAGEFETAAQALQDFNAAYPDGPFAREADILRGDAYQGMGETANAARAYLTAFSDDPNGAHAPRALYKLGASLGALGQTDQACLTLNEVGVRFPGSDQVAQAQATARTLGCS